jgi:hypothetical protein
MSKQLASEAIAALAGRRPVIGGAARLIIDDDHRYCFFSGVGKMLLPGEPETDIFKGVGSRALIVPISSQIGGAAEGVTITLSALDPDIAATIESVDYAGKPFTIWRLVFTPDAPSILLGAMVFMRGRLDYVTVTEKVGGQASIEFHIEGPRRDMSRRGARIRSNADQRVLGGVNDGGLKYVSTVARKTLRWGQKPETAGSVHGGGSTGGSGHGGLQSRSY